MSKICLDRYNILTALYFIMFEKHNLGVIAIESLCVVPTLFNNFVRIGFYAYSSGCNVPFYDFVMVKESEFLDYQNRLMIKES